MIDASALLTQPDPPPPPRRRLLLKAALASTVVGWAALAMGAATPLKGIAERRASAALGRAVTIGGPLRIIVTPFSINFRADEVHVANPDWASGAALLEAGQIQARLATFDLMIGKPGFRALTIEDGTLDLERSANGKQANWTSGKAGTLFDAAAIRRIDADHVTLRYRDPTNGTDTRLALTAGGRGIIDLTGGGRIKGHEVTLNGTLLSSEERPTSFDLRARATDFALILKGSAEAPLRPATAEVTATARGDNFARLATLGGIALPAMPSYDLTARVTHGRKGWRFSHIEGRIGRSDFAGTLALIRRGERPLIVADLSSRALHKADAMALLSLRDGSQDRLLPDAPLSADALRRFDAVVEYRADRLPGLAHAPSHLSMKLALLGGRLQISPASLDLAGGFVSSDLTVDARRGPALVRADIRLSPTPMGRLLRDWGITPAGTTVMVKGRIALAGRGETLREAIGQADGRIALIMPPGEVRTQQASASALDMTNLKSALFDASAAVPASTGLNCGLIAFTVRDGVARADPILIDTDGSTLSGSGTIDLRTETLDLRLKPSAKTIGWFDRPSAVTIGGTLGDAHVMREPVNWFRPASFFGLTMLLPDLKQLFGFVDPDEADAPACGPVLQGAPSSAQRERELASLR